MKGKRTFLTYLLFIIGLQWKTVYALPASCNEAGEFLCKNKDCILDLWKCDGEDDCGDNTDEIGCDGNSTSVGSSKCDSDMFECQNGECITTSWRCDSSDDCGDNSDEKSCNTSIKQPCDQFSCKNGRCIHTEWTCDGVDDCRDGSDESTNDGPFCPKVVICRDGSFKCNNTNKCVGRSFLCDGARDCSEDDLSDEQNCQALVCHADEFKCDNGRCIDKKWRCDGQPNDCVDNSDEKNCKEKVCRDDQFKCPKSNHCIRKEYICDGEVDCVDGADEKSCKTTATRLSSSKNPITAKSMTAKKGTMRKTTKVTATTQAPCRKYEYQCSSDKACIHVGWLCDGEADCSGMEDESADTCSKKVCGTNEFKCKNGRCTQKRYICDSVDQCGDKSDEQNCTLPPVWCSEENYHCKGVTDMCVRKEQLCNKKKDCPNGDDEDKTCGVNECLVKNGGCSHSCVDLKIGFKCTCPNGYELFKNDNFKCVDINECNISGSCSHKCVNFIGSYSCKCNPGYILDPVSGKTCRASAPMPYLVFTDRFDIRQIATNELNYNAVASSDIRSAVAVDVDMTEKMIYWADNIKKVISRVPQDGTKKAEILINTGLDKPDGIAVDWIGRKLYWADTEYDTISVSNLDGSHRKTLVRGNFSDLRTLTVHPLKGLLFWTDWGDKPKIERANLDGTNRETIITDVSWPSAVTVDPTQNRLYWSDLKRMHICSSDLNGGDIKEIVKDLSSPYGLAVFEDYVYWTEFNLKKLRKANKFTGSNVRSFAKMFFEPMDVTIYHPLAQKLVSHPCQKKNGQCSYLCLVNLNKNQNFSCACPDNMELRKDGRTCENLSVNPTDVPINSTSSTFKTTEQKTNTYCSGYSCHSMKMCIPAKSVCDGKPDCPEHDDETSCVASTTAPMTAPGITLIQGKGGKQESSKSSHSYIVIGIFVGAGVLLIVIVIVYRCRKRRTHSGLRMVYEPERELVHSKDTDKSEVKYLPNNVSSRNKKNKNFENVNFKTVDESKMPLQMPKMDGEMMVDEFSGSSDNSSDDMCLIPSNE